MRTILLAMLVAAAAIGLAGTSGGSAAPVNGAVIGDLAKATDSVAQVQWGHWRWGSRGGGGGIEIARLAATIGGETGPRKAAGPRFCAEGENVPTPEEQAALATRMRSARQAQLST